VSELKLKLSYHKADDYSYDLCVAYQDEILRCSDIAAGHVAANDLPRVKKLKSGWRIHSVSHPAANNNDKILYLRGYTRDKDDAEFYVLTEHMRSLAEAVAEFNGRKNVVSVCHSGLIY